MLTTDQVGVSALGAQMRTIASEISFEISGERPVVVDLRDGEATSLELVGAKAASLARSKAAGLPVLPGFVLTTALDSVAITADAVRQAWRALSDDGRIALVVRSSATKEDGETSSMAGLFVSRLDVRGWEAFVEAVADVLASKDGVTDDHGTATAVEMAVLVQPYLAPTWGGVMFGADPISERTDRIVVSAVRGGPDRLVGGEVDGWTATLTRKGRRVEADGGDGPDDRDLRALAAMAVRLERLTGRPQDIEWAIDDSGAVRLLQSRPITTLHGPGSGPLYGPGPLAETFADALSPLEEDLWLDPLRDGLRHALGLLGGSSPGRLRRAPLVISVDGRPAVDLVLLGADPRRRSLLSKIDPRPGVRRLRAGWRVGRLGVALPDLARDLIADIDGDLLAVPALGALGDRDLLRILRNAGTALRALHGYESLAGALLTADPSAGAAGTALGVLAAAAREGVPSEEVVARSPIVLTLIAPRIPPVKDPPGAVTAVRPTTPAPAPTMEGVAREALRVRIRWVHELSARAATELGRRLAATGVIADLEAVRYLRLDELETVLRTGQPFHPTGDPTPCAARNCRRCSDSPPTGPRSPSCTAWRAAASRSAAAEVAVSSGPTSPTPVPASCSSCPHWIRASRR